LPAIGFGQGPLESQRVQLDGAFQGLDLPGIVANRGKAHEPREDFIQEQAPLGGACQFEGELPIPGESSRKVADIRSAETPLKCFHREFMALIDEAPGSEGNGEGQSFMERGQIPLRHLDPGLDGIHGAVKDQSAAGGAGDVPEPSQFRQEGPMVDYLGQDGRQLGKIGVDLEVEMKGAGLVHQSDRQGPVPPNGPLSPSLKIVPGKDSVGNEHITEHLGDGEGNLGDEDFALFETTRYDQIARFLQGWQRPAPCLKADQRNLAAPDEGEHILDHLAFAPECQSHFPDSCGVGVVALEPVSGLS